MLSQSMRYLLPSLLIVVGFLTTGGCMTSPTNNQHLGYYYGSTSKPVTAAGFVDKPNAMVTVEALDWKSGRWVTLATCRASRSAYHWDGRDWYYWQAAPTRLTARMWNSYWGEAEARIRSVSNGTSLFTFDEWNWTPMSDIGDVAEGVNGQEVSIFGWQFEIDP